METMDPKAHIAELRRLRIDFETQASKYPDLALTVYFVVAGGQAAELSFKEPSYAIPLWQYMGHFDKENVHTLSLQRTDLGFSDAQVSAFGVIHGYETDLFRRMAKRAGSLVADVLQPTLNSLLQRRFADPALQGRVVLAPNPDPLAIWLNLIFFAIANYQPERFEQSTLAVDPFAASLAVFDYVLGTMTKRPSASSSGTILENKRFKVALSFPGERRDFVGKVAAHLQERLGDVFYDEYFEAELARPNMDLLLQKIYHDNSELIVIFLCQEYERKEWCGLEWRAIRDLLKKRREQDILPMRFDDATIPGLFSIDGYVDLRRRTPEQAAELIIARTGKSVVA